VLLLFIRHLFKNGKEDLTAKKSNNASGFFDYFPQKKILLAWRIQFPGLENSVSRPAEEILQA
jgi:hypothetical protein